ncbi:MAG TPA: prolyl oligopeptidase family serine peptidase, partial [Planctomycetia bacterium]|nr:prolyl oligopeptidase family serine peptidase [Planctomycetia bacterium]
PKGDLFLDVWSDHKAPTKVVLRRGDGAAVRTVDSNPVHLVSQFKFAPFEFLKIPTPDGFTLEATIVRPKNFDPAKKYPVWFKTYGGPHMPSITDRWSGGRSEDQFLASNGFVVFGCDPRSASGKGAVSSWTAYKQLGVQETKDVETAIAWLLKNHPYCDASRIGMEGHSYGGYLTSYCMTHTKLFAAGIAGAPVTDWANYDSIYTERYMLTPAENPDGYVKSSVTKAAANLHGRLLLLHGLMDDNVHPQNSIQLSNELQKAGKQFDVMFYPTARHGIGGRHYNELKTDFILRNLGKPKSEAPAESKAPVATKKAA